MSCGAIDSPKLLQLSGIGPSELLQELAIPVIQALPSVGEGLRDHPLMCLTFDMKDHSERMSPNAINGAIYDTASDVQILIADGNSAKHYAPYAIVEPFLEKEPATTNLGSFKDAFVLGISGIHFRDCDWLVAIISQTCRKCHFIRHCGVTNPKSAVSVMIHCTDPTVAPTIDVGYFSKEEDMEAMLLGIAKVREMVKYPHCLTSL